MLIFTSLPFPSLSQEAAFGEDMKSLVRGMVREGWVFRTGSAACNLELPGFTALVKIMNKD
jgi:hypothetical protein